MTTFDHKNLSPETMRIIEKSDAETTPQAIMSTPSIKHAWMQPAIQKAIKKAVKHDADSDETADTIDYFDRVIEPRRPAQLMWRMLANVKSLTSEKFQIRRKEKSHLTKTGRGAGTIWSYGERNEYYTVPLDQEIVGNESVDLNMIEDAGYDIQGDVLQSLSMDYDVYMNQLVIDKIAGWLNTSGNIEARANTIGTVTHRGTKFEKSLNVAKGGSALDIKDILKAEGDLGSRDVQPNAALMNPITRATIISSALTSSETFYRDVMMGGLNFQIQNLDGRIDFLVSSQVPTGKIYLYDTERFLQIGERRNKLVVPEITPLKSKYTITGRWGWEFADTGAAAVIA